jgi:uncharacterized protein (DUF433 family)
MVDYTRVGVDHMLPVNQYIETRNGGYYVAGTRIGLDVVTCAFRRGRTAEDIFRAYPAIGSLVKVYGVITFILEHPQEIEAYLSDQEHAYSEFEKRHPLPPEMIEPFEQARLEKAAKPA